MDGNNRWTKLCARLAREYSWICTKSYIYLNCNWLWSDNWFYHLILICGLRRSIFSQLNTIVASHKVWVKVFSEIGRNTNSLENLKWLDVSFWLFGLLMKTFKELAVFQNLRPLPSCVFYEFHSLDRVFITNSVC